MLSVKHAFPPRRPHGPSPPLPAWTPRNPVFEANNALGDVLRLDYSHFDWSCAVLTLVKPRLDRWRCPGLAVELPLPSCGEANDFRRLGQVLTEKPLAPAATKSARDVGEGIESARMLARPPVGQMVERKIKLRGHRGGTVTLNCDFLPRSNRFRQAAENVIFFALPKNRRPQPHAHSRGWPTVRASSMIVSARELMLSKHWRDSISQV